MSKTIFEIESGQFGLAVVDSTAVGYLDSWQAPGGKAVSVVALSDYNTSSAAWSCQITSGALEASPDTTTTDIPATWCEPAETIPAPGKTTYQWTATFLQDANVSVGLNRFLFENDTLEAYIYAGFDGTAPPKMIGRCRLAAGTIGGDARTTLTADLTLPMSRKPDIMFGDATTSAIVVGSYTGTKGAVKNGDSFPPEPTVTAQDATNAAKLTPLGYVAAAPAAWTSGQKMTVGAFSFNWSGTAWAAGAHA